MLLVQQTNENLAGVPPKHRDIRSWFFLVATLCIGTLILFFLLGRRTDGTHARAIWRR